MVKLGCDVFFERIPDFVKGKRCALLTNQTGVNAQFESTIERMFQHPDLELKLLLAPEHGIQTNKREGERFVDMIHPATGLPVISLYGESKKPSPEVLEEIECLVVDIQDIGARYYTYIYTMAYCMQTAKELGIKVIVLDRPNPIGGENVEGNLVESDFSSFIGLYLLPNRHGLTIGELALYFNEACGIDCSLLVIPMEGWERHMLWPDTGLPWVPPSPNTTQLDMMLLYPGSCLLEGTNISEGRGTTQPFEVFGAPFMNGQELQKAINVLELPGLRARAVVFTPTTSKWEGVQCEGVQLHILDRQAVRPVSAMVKILELVHTLYPSQIDYPTFPKLRHPMFDLLAGTDRLRVAYSSEPLDTNFLIKEWNEQLQPFIQMKRKYHLYGKERNDGKTISTDNRRIES